MKKATLSMRLGLNEINELFEHQLLCDQQKKCVIGGGDPTSAQVQALLVSLSNIFVQGTGLTDSHGQQVWQDFNTQLALLAGTNAGFNMLSEIVSSANGRKINITGINPPGGTAGQYTPNPLGGNLLLGGLNFDKLQTDWNYTDQLADHFGLIAHEIYHAYAFFTKDAAAYSAYNSTVSSELDAYLFEFMAAAEIDEKSNNTNPNLSYTRWDDNLYSGGVSSNQHLYLFNSAWFDIFHNKNFTLDNYNILVSNFKYTTQGSSGSYATLSANKLDSTAFSAAPIEDFYSQAYSQSSYFSTQLPTVVTYNPPQPPGINNSGFSVDPNTGQWVYTPSNSSFLENGVFDFESYYWFNYFSANLLNDSSAPGGSTGWGDSSSGSGDPNNGNTGIGSFWNALYWAIATGQINGSGSGGNNGGGSNWNGWPDPIGEGGYWQYQS